MMIIILSTNKNLMSLSAIVDVKKSLLCFIISLLEVSGYFIVCYVGEVTMQTFVGNEWNVL